MSKTRARALEQRDQHASSKRSSSAPPSNNGHGKRFYLEKCHARPAIAEPPSDMQRTTTPHTEHRSSSYLHWKQEHMPGLSTEDFNPGVSWPAVEVQVYDIGRTTSHPTLWHLSPLSPPQRPPPIHGNIDTCTIPPPPPPPPSLIDRQQRELWLSYMGLLDDTQEMVRLSYMELLDDTQEMLRLWRGELFVHQQRDHPRILEELLDLQQFNRHTHLDLYHMYIRAKLYAGPIDPENNTEVGYGRQTTRDAYYLCTESFSRTRGITSMKRATRDRRPSPSMPWDLDDATDACMGLHSTQWQLRDVQGQRKLNAWRCSAGRHKSWRRCPKVFAVTVAQLRLISVQLRKLDGISFRSPLWIPQAFQQYQYEDNRGRGDKLTRLRQQKRVPKEGKWKEYHDLGVHDEPINSMRSHNMGHLDTRTIGQHDLSQQSVEPGKAFIRLVWEKETRANPIGQLDRFLLTGLLLMGRWRVLRFIRNDSHADVYSVEDMHSRGSRRHNSVQMEAHFFMAQYSGSWRTAAKRKQNRLLRSERFQANFYYGDRCMVILKVNQLTEMLDLQQRRDEFPVLGGRKETKLLYAQSEHRSYAEVLRQAILDDGTATRTEIHQLPKTVSVKKMQFPSLAKARRAEKQRLARRAEKQRLARLEQRQAQRTC